MISASASASSAVASSTSRSMSWLYERAPMASRAAACSGPATHAWHSVTSSRSNTASSAVNSKSRGWRKRTFTSSPVASAGNTATALFKFCSWFWRTISSSLADLSLTSSRRAARSDMSSAVLTSGRSGEPSSAMALRSSSTLAMASRGHGPFSF